MPFGQILYGSSASGAGGGGLAKALIIINPIASTMVTNTSPIATVFPLMFLNLLTGVVLGSELKSESSALPGAES